MTTELPYTVADLRAEAADHLNALVIRPNPDDSDRSMRDAWIDSTRGDDSQGPTWGEALSDPTEYAAARDQIQVLVHGAADLGEWAVALGSDGLEPTGHRIEIAGPDGDVAVRLHFAFDADMPTAIRDSVVADVVTALSPVVPLLRKS